MTELEVATFGGEEDSALDDLCRKYWETGVGGTYVYRIADLADSFGIKSHEVGEIVKENAQARVLQHRCGRCDDPLIVRTRSELTTLLRIPPRVCADRLSAEARAKREEAEAEAASKEAQIESRFLVIEDPDAEHRVSRRTG